MTSSTKNDDDKSKKKNNFSIDHILNRAGNCSSYVPPVPTTADYSNFGNFTTFPGYTADVPFTWLQCSRYYPPKVPRRRDCPQKRQLGRHPRIPFTNQQLAVLEDKFQQSPYLSSEEVTRLSTILQLADVRVKIWFQNRRARERREKQHHVQDTQVQNEPETSTDTLPSKNDV